MGGIVSKGGVAISTGCECIYVGYSPLGTNIISLSRFFPRSEILS